MIPENFKDHYRAQLSPEVAELFFRFSEQPLRKSLRVNTLKYSLSSFREYSHSLGWNISPIDWCDTGFFIERPKGQYTQGVGNSFTHALGGLYMQEASSMIPVKALFFGHDALDFSGKIVGDLAASPGSKTTQIAEKMEGKGILVSNELSSSRLKALYSNLERCGVANSLLTHYDAENLCNLLPETFDFLLLDAPCTGEGTIRKDQNALKNWTPEDAPRMAQLQKKLILAAFTALRPGGEMVYSTCTLASEENSDVVQFLRNSFPEHVEVVSLHDLFPQSKNACTPEGYLQVWPHVFDTEGFFVAKIRKKRIDTISTNSTVLRKAKNGKNSFPFEHASKKEVLERNQYLKAQWGIVLPDFFEWWKRGKEWWIFPRGIECIVSRIKVDRLGVKMGEMHSKGWKTDYQFCSCFGKKCTKNTVDITKEELLKVYQGNPIQIPNERLDDNVKKPFGELLLKYDNFAVAVGKRDEKEKWKNQLPRVLLRDLW